MYRLISVRDRTGSSSPLFLSYFLQFLSRFSFFRFRCVSESRRAGEARKEERGKEGRKMLLFDFRKSLLKNDLLSLGSFLIAH